MALVARFFSMSASVLGVGDATLERFESGNTYSEREYFAGDLLVYTISGADDQFLPLVYQLIPDNVTDPRLPFNLACLYAIQGDKEETLRYAAITLRLGKPSRDFFNDPDFDRFKKDSDFIRIVKGRSVPHSSR